MTDSPPDDASGSDDAPPDDTWDPATKTPNPSRKSTPTGHPNTPNSHPGRRNEDRIQMVAIRRPVPAFHPPPRVGMGRVAQVGVTTPAPSVRSYAT
jgi:hypothetical protein